MSRVYKHNYLDKFEGYMPKKPQFINDNYRVSGEQNQFSLEFAYVLPLSRGKAMSVGVQKKIHYASSQGYLIDSIYIGKSNI